MVKIAPSILSADFCRLGEEVIAAEKGGADMIHIDVMDGVFVPNLTIGPPVVKGIRKCTALEFDCHLMVQSPGPLVADFMKAGSNLITVHAESEGDIGKVLREIRSGGNRAGLSLNPPTPLSRAEPFLEMLDLLLVMTVNPGFSGQRFMPEVIPKIEEAHRRIEDLGVGIDLQVDGGISPETAHSVVRAGANVLVAGSAIYGGNVAERIALLREAAESETY
ncbi:MAG: ribulose-phosphate 3-epimerase [Thermoplasmata archaeon]